MGWKEDAERFRRGDVKADESFDSVYDWATTDPILKKYVRSQNKGSHQLVLKVQYISQLIPTITNDTLSISERRGKCPEWQIKTLAKVYQILVEADS